MSYGTWLSLPYNPYTAEQQSLVKQTWVIRCTRLTWSMHSGPWYPPRRPPQCTPNTCGAQLSSTLDGFASLIAPVLLESLSPSQHPSLCAAFWSP
jgi:hypothetical protein